jgi:hypothetical protein
VKLKCMEDDRLVRRLAGGVAGSKLHWSKKILAVIEGDKELRRAYERIQQSAVRNGNVLPQGADLTLPDQEGEATYFPVKSWIKAVGWWVRRQDREEKLKLRPSTTRVIARMCEGEQDMPKFPLTKLPNSGPDQIRARLLVGTSGLNVTMSKIKPGVGEGCPFGCCVREDPICFLTRCKGYSDLRRDFESRLETSCTCRQRLGEKERDPRSCSDFYQALNAAGKAAFMLGGPVDQRQPEANVDCASRFYVQAAYERRSELLNSQATDPLVIDLTAGVPAQVRGVAGAVSAEPPPALFPLFIAARPMHPIFAPPPARRRNARPADRSAQHVHVRSVMSARSPRAPDGQAADSDGSGSNGKSTRESV